MPYINKDTDSWDTLINGYPSGMYYYFLSKDQLSDVNASAYIGNCPSIQSMLYTPLLDIVKLNNFNVEVIPYDIDRFATDKLPYTPLVFRIRSYQDSDIDIGSFNPYPYRGATGAGVKYDWRNEGKLWNYPYSSWYIADFMNAPLEIKPHLLTTPNLCEVKAKFTISDKCTYSIYAKGYMNDGFGKLEGAVSCGGLDMPVSSSAYAQFSASSKAQFIANNTISVMDAQTRPIGGINQMLLSPITNTVQAVGQALTGNIPGALTTALTGGLQQSAQLKDKQAMRDYEINSAKRSSHLSWQGLQQDLRNTPRSVKTMGGDVTFSRLNSQRQISAIRIGITYEYAERLGKMFHMFGYKQEDVRVPDINSRYFFDFLKCYKCNIKSNIPKKYANKIKSIYERGVTTWHVDRPGVVPLDYSWDNYELIK